MKLRTFDDLKQLTDRLVVIADWRDDLHARIRTAQLCFETIGLSEERRAALVHEADCFNRVCSDMAKEFS
jgi:hypothetical protein